MMEILNGMCKLCLEKCENFKTIDESTKNAFGILLPKIDFTIMQGHVMCKSCTDMLTKCFDFKVKFLRNYDYIVAFVNKDNAELDLRDVYMSKNATDTDIPEDQDICGLCMGLVRNCSAVSLDVEERNVTLEKMIEECLPELDLSIIKKPMICAPCLESLEDCFRFVTTCLIVEKRIRKYCDTLDINSEGQVEPNRLLQLTKNDVATRDVEEQSCEDRKNPYEEGIGKVGDLIKLEQMNFDSEVAYDDLESKNQDFMEFDDQKIKDEQLFTPNNLWTHEEESKKLESIKIEEILCGENETTHNRENLVEIEDRKFLINAEVEIKADEDDFNRFENCNVLPQSEVCLGLPSEITIYNCDACSFQTTREYDLKYHLLRHKDPEVKMYKCESCFYQTEEESYLKMHEMIHRGVGVHVYKCASCPFQTKDPYFIEKHLMKHTKKIHLVHKDPSQVAKRFKCDSCSYQTHYKHHFDTHSLKHKDPSEVTMYKCTCCSYQTRFKQRLKDHVLMHKDPSEVTMYKCDCCIYQTKYKRHLKRHELTHKTL